MREHLEQLNLPEGGNWKLDTPLQHAPLQLFPSERKNTPHPFHYAKESSSAPRAGHLALTVPCRLLCVGPSVNRALSSGHKTLQKNEPKSPLA